MSRPRNGVGPERIVNGVVVSEAQAHEAKVHRTRARLASAIEQGRDAVSAARELEALEAATPDPEPLGAASLFPHLHPTPGPELLPERLSGLTPFQRAELEARRRT